MAVESLMHAFDTTPFPLADGPAQTLLPFNIGRLDIPDVRVAPIENHLVDEVPLVSECSVCKLLTLTWKWMSW